MHVDIRWIKQRPHFLAEQLSIDNDLLVLYAYSFIRKNLVNSSNKFNSFPFLIFPFFFKSKFIRRINSFILKIIFKLVIIFFKPKFIWISSPFQFNFFFKNDKKKIIYDCMDNFVDFFNDSIIKNEINILEKKIDKSARKIFCSSTLLFKKFDKDKTFVINNAYSEDWSIRLRNYKLNNKILKKNITICYFGTISNWIDFDLLLFVSRKYKFVKIKLIGPFENIPKEVNLSKSFQFIRSTNHENLLNQIMDVDIFIMPFILNNLILHVDPVKVYEYILLNKPIILPYYDELKKFSKFVKFYKNKSEFINLVDSLSKSSFQLDYSKKDMIKFLRSNSWENRAHQINNILKKN